MKYLFDRFDREELPAGVPPRVVSAWRVAAVASVFAHAALISVGVARSSTSNVVTTERTYPLPTDDAPIVVELPPMTNDVIAETTQTNVLPSPPAPQPGGAKIAQIDSSHESPGHGGDVTTTMKARNLAANAEDETTTSSYRDAIDAEQENRLETSKLRASKLDVRSALEPMELTFVASGKGFRYERHPVAKLDASTGMMHGKGIPSGAPSNVGAVGEGTSQPMVGGVASPKGGATYGVVGMPSLASGANVVRARPHVLPGKPNVTSDTKASARDNVDSDQAVAAAFKSVVSNSTNGAAAIADGKGGSGGGGDPGSGGKSGAGSTSTALGNGSGDANGPHDLERTTWFADLQKRLGPLVRDAFPREHELELRNGTVIVDLVIAKGGGVVDVIVVRPSGFDDFDQNVVTRIRGAKTLEPVPDLLSQGSITVRVPVHGGWRLQ